MNIPNSIIESLNNLVNSSINFLNNISTQDLLNNVGLFCTISGLTASGIFSIFFIIYKNCIIKKYFFTKKDKYEVTKGYIQPKYKLENCTHKGALDKILYKTSESRIIFVLGDVGSGKTNLINRFIWKYKIRYSVLRKNIALVQGLECDNILMKIDQIENKEDTILLFDGLEEAFLYQSNDSTALQSLKTSIDKFLKVIVTMNSDFYNKNQKIFSDVYYRSYGAKKIYPIKVFLEPFTDEMIKKYIKKILRPLVAKKGLL